MDRGAWWATVHVVAKSQTNLAIKQKQRQTKTNLHRLQWNIQIQIIEYLKT